MSESAVVPVLPDDPSPDEAARALESFEKLWWAKLGSRRLPSRKDFDIAELRPWVGWINLLEVVGDPPRFRYRLVGTRLSLLHDRDPTGRYLDEVVAQRRYGEIIAALVRAVAERVPVADHVTVRSDGGAKYQCVRCLLPLSEDDGEVTMLMELLIGRLLGADRFPGDASDAVAAPSRTAPARPRQR
jgi:hypothetical protein